MSQFALDTETGMRVFKALGDENRLRIMLALSGRELCVCQMVNLLGLSHFGFTPPPDLKRGKLD